MCTHTCPLMPSHTSTFGAKNADLLAMQNGCGSCQGCIGWLYKIILLGVAGNFFYHRVPLNSQKQGAFITHTSIINHWANTQPVYYFQLLGTLNFLNLASFSSLFRDDELSSNISTLGGFPFGRDTVYDVYVRRHYIMYDNGTSGKLFLVSQIAFIPTLLWG